MGDYVFTFKKMVHVLTLLVILLLVSCSNQTPLIIEEVDSITVQCMGTEELLEITDEKMLKKIIKEINNSRREGAEEMEFPEGHDVSLITTLDEKYNISLYEGGKTLLEGFYIHSNIPDFCDK